MVRKIIFLLVLVFVAVPITSACSSDSVDITEGEVCDPDPFLSLGEIIFCTELDGNGDPRDPGTSFSKDTPSLYFIYIIRGEICCQDVIIDWKHSSDENVTNLYAATEMIPRYQLVPAPEGGFKVGEYTVTLNVGQYISGERTFTIY